MGGKADGEYHRDAWEKFGNKVGWRDREEGWIDYSEVRFSTSAVDGHLPLLGFWRWVVGRWVGGGLVVGIFSRIETCKL